MRPEGSSRLSPLVVPIHSALLRSSNSDVMWSSLIVAGSSATERKRVSLLLAGSRENTPSPSLPIQILPLDAARIAVIGAPPSPRSSPGVGRIAVELPSGFQRITPSDDVPSQRFPVASASIAVIAASSGWVRNFANPPVAGSKRFSPPALIANHMRSLRCLLYTSDAADERSSVDLGG